MIPILMGLGLGALLGGGVAAAQGKDPLQGALMGGLGGALGGAFMPGVAGAAGAGAAEGAAASATGGGGFLGGSTDILAGATGTGGGSLGAVTPATVTPGLGAASSGGFGSFLAANKYPLLGGAIGGMMAPDKKQEQPSAGNIYDYEYTQEKNPNFGAPGERYFSSQKFALKGVTPVEEYKPMAAAGGGIVALAEGGNVSRFRDPAGAINPAVAAYNNQLMEMANQQYNINRRPAPNQVPGSAGYVAPPTTPAATTTTGTGTDVTTTNISADPISGKATRYNPVTKRFEGEYGAAPKSDIDKYREELFAELDARYGRNYDTGNSGGGEGGANGGGEGGGAGGGDGAGGGCVDPNVLVLMSDGSSKRAGDVEVGDSVFAPHEHTLEYSNYEVLAAEVITQPKLLVKFDDGSSIKVSDTHKFLMSNNQWKQMLDIKLSDVVRGLETDKRIVGMEYIGEGDVIKFTIDQAHTYISDGLVSHNDKKKGGLIKHRYAMGGLSSIGNYSDGGQLLRGPGDGVSDSIPANIDNRQPARLADGEFVVPARIVSEIGNGSTAAGAKRLYAMMDRVQNGRKKTVGKGKVAVDSKAHKMLPA